MELNPNLVLDCLKILTGDDVILNFTDSKSPLKITSVRHPNYTYFTMPIRMD